MPLFYGRGALGRTLIARAAAEEEQRRLPLQKVAAGTLSLEWVRQRLNNKTLQRFDAVWRNALQTPQPHSPSQEPKLRINEADAKEMERVGVICEASQKPTKGLAAPFAVVEAKAAGLRGVSLHCRRVTTTMTIMNPTRRFGSMRRTIWLLLLARSHLYLI
ncbi:hypothetical protein TRVL_10174 [Trypanosoma vivax]|nr:hypothetical protein TRVL_10174 [Trypanosoma vivax]